MFPPSTARCANSTPRHAKLRGHWAKLAERLNEPVLADGAQAADELLIELEQRVDLSGRPTAQFAGARLAGARGISDLLLERNQALRSALLDIQHVVTLLDYLADLAAARGDADLEPGTSAGGTAFASSRIGDAPR